MNKIIISCRVVSCLIMLLVLTHWKISGLFLVSIDTFSGKAFLVVIALLFFLLNTISAFGLFFTKRWGFWFAYIAIIFSTIFFSVAYIPFVSKIFAENIRYIPMIVGNFLVFIFTAYLHLSLHSKSSLYI